MPKSCPGPVELCFVTHYLDDLVVPTSLLYLIKMNSLSPNSKSLTNTLYLSCSNVLKQGFEKLAFINFDFASLCRLASRWLLGWASLLPPSLSTILSTSWHQQQSTKVFCSLISSARKPFLIVKFNHLTSDQYECFCLNISLFLFNSDLVKMEGKKAARKLRVKRKTKENRKGPD